MVFTLRAAPSSPDVCACFLKSLNTAPLRPVSTPNKRDSPTRWRADESVIFRLCELPEDGKESGQSPGPLSDRRAHALCA